MSRVAWTFYDPVEIETYSWEVNPNEGGSPSIEKKIGTSLPTAPDGFPVFYQAMSDPQKLDFSGVILDQDQYDTMVDWASRDRIILITDDLDREFQVKIVSFDPKRVRKSTRPYYHTYSMSCIIMA